MSRFRGRNCFVYEHIAEGLINNSTLVEWQTPTNQIFNLSVPICTYK
jgi:hypothetical protein